MALAIGLVFVLSLVLDERAVPESRGRVLALLVVFFGLMVAGSAVTGFGRARTSVDPHTISKASALVTGGVYRFTRNPMYLGLLCLVIGFGLWRGSLIATFVGAVAFVVTLTKMQIIPEEKMLAKRFGKPYREFRKSVRRWL